MSARRPHPASIAKANAAVAKSAAAAATAAAAENEDKPEHEPTILHLGRMHPAIKKAREDDEKRRQEEVKRIEERKKKQGKASTASANSTATALDIDEAELKRIEAEEKREAELAAERAKGENLTTGKLDWKQYLEPGDKTNLEECQSIDRYNNGVFAHNNKMAPEINALLDLIGGQQHVMVRRPPHYYSEAKRSWAKVLWNPEFRMLKAVEWLWVKRAMVPIRDYKLVEGPELADGFAFELERDRLLKEVRESGVLGVDITTAVGETHRANCTCDNYWDGVSERCLGKGPRIKWVPLKGHHFLKPSIAPVSY